MSTTNLISKHTKNVEITPETIRAVAVGLEGNIDGMIYGVVSRLATKYGFDKEDANKYLNNLIELKWGRSDNIKMADMTSEVTQTTQMETNIIQSLTMQSISEPIKNIENQDAVTKQHHVNAVKQPPASNSIADKEQNYGSMSPSLLVECIELYNNTTQSEREINNKLKNKKIRLSNFPSHISEAIAMYAINKEHGFMPNWDSTDKGDLCYTDQTGKKIRFEVKGSINLYDSGPVSFGPTEEWDKIYFVDGVNTQNKIYKVYEVELSNVSEIWKSIKVSKKQTYYEQCLQKRRPRIQFCGIHSQLGKNCKLIFDGHISTLF